MSSLKDKVILITGSGDEAGIGAATAQYLVQFQPKLVLTGRDTRRLERAGQLCTDAGLSQERLLLVTADVDNDADLERLVLSTIQTFKQLDVLVNNAGILMFKTSLDSSLEEFDHVMRTNIRAPFYLCKLCMPHLIKSKGNIVNMSSIGGKGVYPEAAAYCISKTALDKLTKVLAMEFAAQGVRVNSINPGLIKTDIFKKAGKNGEEYDKLMESAISQHPLGRVGAPLDVAKAIVFLASDDSSFITGETMSVDGGRNTKSV